MESVFCDPEDPRWVAACYTSLLPPLASPALPPLLTPRRQGILLQPQRCHKAFALRFSLPRMFFLLRVHLACTYTSFRSLIKLSPNEKGLPWPLTPPSAALSTYPALITGWQLDIRRMYAYQPIHYIVSLSRRTLLGSLCISSSWNSAWHIVNDEKNYLWHKLMSE